MLSRSALCQVWWVAGSREHQSATPFPPAASRRRGADRSSQESARRGTFAGSSLNDLLRSNQHRLRDRQAERLRRLEVDYKLELRGLLDWQVGGLNAFENPINVSRGASPAVEKTRPVGHEATSLPKSW